MEKNELEEATQTTKPFKVFSRDREARKGVVASSFEDLKDGCKEKFVLDSTARITFVLEEDGTEIDTSYFKTLPANTKLILLVDDDVWQPVAGSSTSCSGSSSADSTLFYDDDDDDDDDVARNILTIDTCRRYFHLSDSTTVFPRGQPGYDKLHHIRSFMTNVQACIRREWNQGRGVAIDEAMIAYKGRLGFKASSSIYLLNLSSLE
ncbi:uncharacterized protein LOC117318117 [Pecten maximus]|uniref:uncharacterized protein LOC117318117 n=1 Tax=Pecten maximus TaxID=6579 RepID=UPI001458E6F5|nr:uncharacterized protein LOC117318117 [Pecten maximus]